MLALLPKERTLAKDSFSGYTQRPLSGFRQPLAFLHTLLLLSLQHAHLSFSITLDALCDSSSAQFLASDSQLPLYDFSIWIVAENPVMSEY